MKRILNVLFVVVLVVLLALWVAALFSAFNPTP